MKILRKAIKSTAAAIAMCTAFSAHAVPITLTKLTGLTGGAPAATAVYVASLADTGLSSIAAISITDNSGGLGGATGQFSGFDLDALILSNTLVGSAGGAGALVGLAGLDYGAGTTFIPGSQRAPADAKLFGTDLSGTDVNNAVATLGAFDGNATTAIPGAGGFISLGDGGRLIFNLAAPISTAGLYLYLGEVGDNGEVLTADIQAYDTPVHVPEPGALGMLAAGTALLAWRRRQSA